jgi:hypothetical protein
MHPTGSWIDTLDIRNISRWLADHFPDQAIGNTMAKPEALTVRVMVESYNERGSGLYSDLHIRPVSGQQFATTLRVRCSKGLTMNYPEDARISILAKLTDREGSS